MPITSATRASCCTCNSNTCQLHPTWARGDGSCACLQTSMSVRDTYLTTQSQLRCRHPSVRPACTQAHVYARQGLLGCDGLSVLRRLRLPSRRLHLPSRRLRLPSRHCIEFEELPLAQPCTRENPFGSVDQAVQSLQLLLLLDCLCQQRTCVSTNASNRIHPRTPATAFRPLLAALSAPVDRRRSLRVGDLI
jgi:hypothetical protein